jgi:hypothetical protein
MSVSQNGHVQERTLADSHSLGLKQHHTGKRSSEMSPVLRTLIITRLPLLLVVVVLPLFIVSELQCWSFLAAAAAVVLSLCSLDSQTSSMVCSLTDSLV